MTMIHDITSALPRHKRRLRKGRGESSGHGKTSGRGTKGSGARVGKPIKPGHEGGQTPIYRRLPHRGFSNHAFERDYHIVNICELERFEDGTTVDAAALIEAGLVPDDRLPVKILGGGSFSRKLTVVAGWYSKSALERITTAGGTAQNGKGEAFAFPKPKKIFVKREAPKEVSKKDKKAAAAEEVVAPAATPEAPKPAEG